MLELVGGKMVEEEDEDKGVTFVERGNVLLLKKKVSDTITK